MRRVVVTGMSGVCPLGKGRAEALHSLAEGVLSFSPISAEEEIQGLRARQIGKLGWFQLDPRVPRRAARSMGRVAMLAAEATLGALEDAGLLGDAIVARGRTGIAYGSMLGSPSAIEAYANRIGIHRSLHGITAAQFVRLMSHTTAANLAQLLGCSGRVIPTGADCASGGLALVVATEAIRWGLQDVMIAGGSEEAHLFTVSILDSMGLTSDRASGGPRPFDIARDGLIVSEGAATLVLEERQHALARGARILGEIAGIATRFSPTSGEPGCSDSDARFVASLMTLAIEDAGRDPSSISHVCANAAGVSSDSVEARAIARVFGSDASCASLKGQLGESLGASGALAAWLTLEQMNQGWLAPTLHLSTPDPESGEIDHLQARRPFSGEAALVNTLGLSGAGASIAILRG